MFLIVFDMLKKRYLTYGQSNYADDKKNTEMNGVKNKDFSCSHMPIVGSLPIFGSTTNLWKDCLPLLGRG